jgi:hypothetical protein
MQRSVRGVAHWPRPLVRQNMSGVGTRRAGPGSIRHVNGTGYKLLGLVVWRGGKWYLRKRAPSRRKLVLIGAGGVTAAAGAVVLARRLAS